MSDKQGANVAVWYVNGDGGADNTTSSRGQAYNNAWDTIQFAFDKIADGTVTDGDEIRICKTSDDATHYAVGTALNPAWDQKEITITGANASGLVDNTQVILTATASITAILDIGAGECERMVWANLHFDGADTATYCVNSAATNHYQKWLNCRFSQATSHGLYKLANYWDFANCRFDNNGGDGLRMDSTSYASHYKCLFDNNAACGVDTGTENAYRHNWFECVFYNNGTIGFDCSGAGSIICNCIFDNNGEEGLKDRGSSIQTCRAGNIYSNNTEGGVNYHSTTDSVAFNELFYNNRHDTEDTGADADGISELGHMINYIAGASAENPNYTNAAGLDFTPTKSGGYVGAGMPIPYKWNGSNADDIGLGKWVNTESISTF
jgi:hypothetical protein